MAETQLAWQDQRLLSLIREGRVDAEIAVRLGVSTAEVKERVQNLASELGVGGRAGLLHTSALAPRPIMVAPAPAVGAVPETIRRTGRLRVLPGLVALAIFAAVAGLLVFNSGSRDPAGPASERGTAALTLPADPVVPRTGNVVQRYGREVVNAGFVLAVPGAPSVFEQREQRGEVSRLVFSGRAVFSPAPVDGIDWTGVQVRLHPQTFTYMGTAAGRPVRLHLLAADSTSFERTPDGRLAVFAESGSPEILAWVDDFRTEFTADGQLFIDREELPLASAVAYDTGEALDLSNAVPLGFGSDGWNGTFCGEGLNACYVVTRPGPASVPASGELVCSEGVLRLNTSAARLEFHRLEPSGPEWPGCDASSALPVSVRAGDAFTREHYRITAFDSQGNQLSIVAGRDGRLFIGVIQPLYACPCRQGS